MQANFIGSAQYESEGRVVRSEPRWAHRRWSVYDRVLCDIPRTNNFCESYNKQLNSSIENKKPPFYTFVKKLQARSQDKKIG